jgi:WxcM-like, C-terminal
MVQKKPYIFEFGLSGNDEIGHLSVAEYASSLPFELKRVYWVYNTPINISRGNAANKICKYALVCLTGSAKVHIEDLFNNTYHFELSGPNQGLFIPEMHWRRVQLSTDAMMLSIASEKFDTRDYIRDFKEFMDLKKAKI